MRRCSNSRIGAFATAVYSGYGHFDSDEFRGWIGEMGLPKDRERHGAVRKALSALTPPQEAAFKAARNYGGTEYSVAVPMLRGSISISASCWRPARTPICVQRRKV